MAYAHVSEARETKEEEKFWLAGCLWTGWGDLALELEQDTWHFPSSDRDRKKGRAGNKRGRQRDMMGTRAWATSLQVLSGSLALGTA